MSATELEIMRKEVKDLIDHADEQVIQQVYDILEGEESNQWWEKMPENIKSEVRASIAQADRGELITHEDMKKKHPEWFTK